MRIVTTIGICLLLTGCSPFDNKEKAAEENSLGVTGTRTGLSAVGILDTGSVTIFPRPSAPMGFYIAAYLAQGVFLPVRSAALGVEAQKKLFAGQGNPVADETFTLLQELGNVLQVNVSDVLNRSPDRRVALDQYLQALQNVFVLSERKKVELDTTAETLRKEEREKRENVQEMERTIRDTLDHEDYTGAGGRQRELSEAQGTLAQVATKREQTEDIADRYRELLEVAKKRLVAIEANRLILIAGLQVIQLPGIEDLDILLEKGQRRRTTSPIGADKLR